MHSKIFSSVSTVCFRYLSVDMVLLLICSWIATITQYFFCSSTIVLELDCIIVIEVDGIIKVSNIFSFLIVDIY
jgi:hypothetical protein